MIWWVFSFIISIAVLFATFVTDIRRAILSLWVVGLGIGGLYLTLGAEFLAVVQWIISTLVAISFIFFAVMFGEYGSSDTATWKKRVLPIVLTVILGLSFAAIVWLGAGEVPEAALAFPTEGSDLVAIGKSLTQNHLLSLEVLALNLFIVLVGGGVIARPDKTEKKAEKRGVAET